MAASILATVFISRAANAKYDATSKTVTAYKAVSFLPLRSVVTLSGVEAVRVPMSMGQGLATAVTGRTLLTSVMPGDLIYANELSANAPLPRGTVSVSVAVNQSSGDEVTAGDVVDVWSAGNTTDKASLVAEGAKVLSAYDAEGNPVSPGIPASGLMSGLKAPGGRVAAVVELMVSQAAAPTLVQDSRNIYLVRVR